MRAPLAVLRTNWLASCALKCVLGKSEMLEPVSTKKVIGCRVLVEDLGRKIVAEIKKDKKREKADCSPPTPAAWSDGKTSFLEQLFDRWQSFYICNHLDIS